MAIAGKPPRTAAARRERFTQLLDSARREFTEAIEAGRGGRAAHRCYADRVDNLMLEIAALVRTETAGPLAVCALGGYGRQLLCLHSDIDLLVLFGGRIGRAEERAVKVLLHPLWDLKLTVGHHVREFADLERLDPDNLEFSLALLDARLLHGDRDLCLRFSEFLRDSSTGTYPRMLDALLVLTAQRHARFDDTLHHLEPNVKSAPGALRDIWTMRTLSCLAGTGPAPAPSHRLEEAEEFFLKLRSGLHLDTGRNCNVLSHELQEKAAVRLGDAGAPVRLQVEALMSEYFRHARTVSRGLARTRRAVRPAPPITPQVIGDNLVLVADGVTFGDAPRAAAAPATWLDAFAAAVTRRVPVADGALTLIERAQAAGAHPPEAFVPTGRHRHDLLRFLQLRPGLSARLFEMRDCGLLGAIFPELENISCLVTRDFYHRYTVDEHTLLTIRSAEHLLGDERIAPVLRELRAPELLVLALLFHDVGKSRAGDHSEEGVAMIQPVLARLGLDAEPRHTVEFLIRHHVKMSRVAFRRDTEDPDVVRQFSALFGTEEHLKLLFLMTLADVGSVSPETLTAWKKELLWRLYVDTYNQMTLGYGDEIIDRNQAMLTALEANRPADIAESDVARFLEGLPRRYLQLFTPESIYRHVRLSRDIRPDDAHFSLDQKGEVWELTVVTLDTPFLFSNICGVLSYFGMDILRGHAMTSLGGLVVDVFQFTDREGFVERNLEGRSQVTRMLSNVVTGRADVTALLRGKERSVLYRRGPRRPAPVIYFDQEYSQRYTVLELVADDALGLLYRVSRVISRHGCDVDLVLISTEGQKAIDVFHITKGAAKLSESAQLALKDDLTRLLEEGYETH